MEKLNWGSDSNFFLDGLDECGRRFAAVDFAFNKLSEGL
jgi:hypothetical protein